MRLEDFVRSADWQALPFPIQAAVAHVWRVEQDALSNPTEERAERTGA